MSIIYNTYSELSKPFFNFSKSYLLFIILQHTASKITNLDLIAQFDADGCNNIALGLGRVKKAPRNPK